MGVLTDLFRPKIEKRGSLDQLLTIGWGAPTASGVKVSEESSLTYSAVWACVRILSESLASMPLILYQKDGDSRERAERHPLYRLLKDQPNPYMTSMEFRELLASHLATWGNGLAEIQTNAAGRVTALWPMRPDKIEKMEWIDNTLVYWYRNPSHELQPMPFYRVMHWKGLGSSGYWGWSPVRMHMEAVGLGLGMQEFGARFFGNGARPGMLLRHPGRLSPEAYARLKSSFQADHGGLSNAHRTKILEEGMDITTIGVPPEEAQFLESRKFQVTEIARIYRVPPHMLADLDRATFSNIEHQSIDFVTHTLRPWMVRIEQAIQRDLLTEPEAERYFVKHLADAMLRGDTLSRSQAQQLQLQTGLLTINEGRAQNDLPPIEGGNELYMPLNIAPISMARVAETPTAPAASEPAGDEEDRSVPIDIETRRMEIRADRLRIMNRYVRLFEDAIGRLVKREVSDIRRVVPRRLTNGSIGEFEEWLATFYEDLRGVVPGYLLAAMQSLADEILEAVADEVGGDEPVMDAEWIDEYLANFAAVYTVGGEKQLRTLLAESANEEEATEAILERMDGWEENRASKSAFDQAIEAGNAIALFGMITMGVTEKVWTGGDCPLCQKLNGMVVGIEQNFLSTGDELEVDDEDTANLPIVRNIGHPPLHGGCDCVILAG
jgi:HK97 family phage portal protein